MSDSPREQGEEQSPGWGGESPAEGAGTGQAGGWDAPAQRPGAPAGGWSSAPVGPWGGGPGGGGPGGGGPGGEGPGGPGPSGHGPGGWAASGATRPDPAAVAGPPWPELIAVGSFTPPRMIRWPIIGGLLLVVIYVVFIVVVTSSTSISHAAWLADHEGTINTLNRDQQNLAADNPSQGGNASQWIADWRALHSDSAAAAELSNPGGSATAPWREMINDYYNGSSEIIQAIENHDSSLLLQAQRDLQAGDVAAAEFNKAMGISSP